ncbi:hypothetical protein CAEBREN_17832 [Caenorhabditis brenneri]|uniref:Uncharacterized protein n=1 Tax=Caenorhabditis brenneri TaxID=135651 RepID=G0P5N0_CAEBE|nr:hypothetical protein CAEBREN_17832 [Caenorhabditis brenneri]
MEYEKRRITKVQCSRGALSQHCMGTVCQADWCMVIEIDLRTEIISENLDDKTIQRRRKDDFPNRPRLYSL